MSLTARERLHMQHRCWRLRFKSEVDSVNYVRNNLKRNTTVLDIGANKGVFSIYMSRAVGDAGRLVAFEAQPELGEHLLNVKESFSLTNMTLVNEGLSAEEGVLIMRRTEAGSGTASFHNEPGQGIEAIDIPVTTLDTYAAASDLSAVSFIKCDVESHELPVFKGGEELLRRDLPTLLFECHDSEAQSGELFDYLRGLGYDGFFYYVTQDDHNSWFNKNRGEFVHYSKYKDYDYVRPSIKHRNYIFVRNGQRP